MAYRECRHRFESDQGPSCANDVWLYLGRLSLPVLVSEADCEKCGVPAFEALSHAEVLALFRKAPGKANASPAQPLPQPAAPPPVPIEQGPGWFKKAVNFTKAAVKHVWFGLPQAPTPLLEQRISLCLVCEHLNPQTGGCNQCGCPVATKAAWGKEKCPVGKW